MSNRLSYASSPDSDVDMRPGMFDDDDDSPPVRRKMIRSSSDPSIATGENVPGIPPYPAPPNYRRDHRPVSTGVSNFQHVSVFGISHHSIRQTLQKW